LGQLTSIDPDPRVFRAQLEFVSRLTERSHVAAFAISTAFVAAVPAEEGSLKQVLWWLTLNGIALARVYLGRRFVAGDHLGWSLTRWAVVTAGGAWASGLSWGYFLALLAPDWGDPAFPVSVFMAAGIPAVSLLANAALLPSYVGIVVPILVPYGLKLMLRSSSEYEALGGLAAIIYAGVFLMLGLLVHRGIVESFRLRFRNEDLVSNLSAANAELAAEMANRTTIEAGLREARESADAANSAKSRFLARMSHEIRTPLNGILGMTEILRGTTLTADQREQTETIHEAGRSLLRVINDILDFSKVEAGKLSLQAADFSVREVVQHAVALLRPRAESRGVSMAVEVDPSVPTLVHGDSGRLRQILINLIGNAEKFTPAGGISVAIRPVDPLGDPHHLRFEVLDTGVGIEATAQEHLFQPFVQVDESHARPHGGTGLGLAISHQLVSLMGGAMGVESELGKGARFWFTTRFAPPRFTGEQRRPAAFSTGDLLGAFRADILLVDDNEVNRLVGATFLKQLGCTVEEATDGEEAARLALSRTFDLILMDCEMPLLDGYEATRRIRRAESERGDGRHIPIVALTASALTADRERALAAGMDDYLAKPFRLIDLHSVMKPFLKSAPPTDQATRASTSR
jgi:signal transduction histidine kinase/ActR/RegA family two-component response regulator